jgi:hypothetical protein
MKYPSVLIRAALILTASILAASRTEAGHIYAGIIDTNGIPGLQPGDALAFINETTTATDPHYGKPITGADCGTITLNEIVSDASSPQHDLYSTNAPTFTALSRGLAINKGNYMTELKEFAASSHSFIEAKLVSVTGPDGAHFSFWESGSSSATFTFKVGTGLTIGSGIFHITDPAIIVGDGTTPLPLLPAGAYTYPSFSYAPNPAGQPSSTTGLPLGFTWNNPNAANGTAAQDPFGHIHGRRFTFDQPGNYSVTYILTDANGIQADSAPFTIAYAVAPKNNAEAEHTTK